MSGLLRPTGFGRPELRAPRARQFPWADTGVVVDAGAVGCPTCATWH